MPFMVHGQMKHHMTLSNLFAPCRGQLAVPVKSIVLLFNVRCWWQFFIVPSLPI